MKSIYMDYAATTPVDPRVKQAMEPYWTDHFGNSSSGHTIGQDAARVIESARQNIADMLNAGPEEIVFTGSGSEADNMAIKGICYNMKDKGNHIITTNIEHSAVLKTCEFMKTQGFEVTFVPVAENGIVQLEDIKKAIKPETIFISVMHANNEIGTIQPVREIGLLAKENNILFHTDAVQTFGHIPIDVRNMNIDALAISAHKLYGPKGVGVLYLRNSVPVIPLIHGGGHENGRRSSTQNTPGIVGLAKAAEIAQQEMQNERKRLVEYRNKLWQLIKEQIKGVHMNGDPDERLPNNLNISIEKVEGESLLMNLDMEGVAVSSGSACSSGSGEPSHVLSALNLSDNLLRGSLRITIGRFTSEEEIHLTAEKLAAVVAHLRSLSS